MNSTGGGSRQQSTDCHFQFNLITNQAILDYVRPMLRVTDAYQLSQSVCANTSIQANGLILDYQLVWTALPPPDPTVMAADVAAAIYLPVAVVVVDPDAGWPSRYRCGCRCGIPDR